MSMPTIIQVAAMAGVSTATVSRVMSHPDRVAEATRRRVLEVVESLGYKPNVAARTLRTLRAAKLRGFLMACASSRMTNCHFIFWK